MKKNLFKCLILIIALLMTFTVCACGSDSNNEDQTSSNDSGANNSTTESTTSSEDVITSETASSETGLYKYETETLKFYEAVQKDTETDTSNNFIEIDGCGKYELDADGNVIIDKYKVSDFKGKIVYFFDNAIGNDLVVFSHADDGKVYINSYDPQGNKADHDNDVLTFKHISADAEYQVVEEIEFKNTYTAGFVVKINGKYYHDKISGLNVKNPYLFITELADCEKVFELGYRNPYPAVSYAKSGDDTAVYFHSGSTEYTVHLPDGYKASDIAQLSFGLTIAVVMNDKTVCTVEADRSAKEHTLVINDEASKLNKDGKVKKVYVSGYNQACDVLLEMDDGNIYKIAE